MHESSPPSPTLVEKIWDQKVPQLLGTYLAVGFGVLQFVEFVINRYQFNSAWIDRYLLLWLGLIPAVSLLLYYRGLPPGGRGSAGIWKRGVFFLNLLIVGLVVIAVPGSAGGPALEKVSVANVAGDLVERLVPSSSAVQRVAIFEFENENPATDEGWWGMAYALLLNDYLRQRPEVLTTSPVALNSYYDRVEEKKYNALNTATQRKIAQRARTDYFVRATYKLNELTHEVNGALYRTKDGKAVQTLSTNAGSIYEAVENIAAQINDFLPLLRELDGISTQLPAASLLTDQPEALEAYTKGVIAFDLQPNQLEVAMGHYRTSLRLDPNCAICAYEMGDKFYGMGKKDSSLVMLRKATRLAEVLPEREQYGYKMMLLNVSGEYESLAKLMESYRRTYPYEYYPYQVLESYYTFTYGLDSTIHLMEQAAAVSDREKALNSLYKLYLKAERYTDAENTVKDLEQEFPDPEITQRRFAEVYRSAGDITKARGILQEMIAVDPLNIELQNQLLQLELSSGNFFGAEDLARKVLQQATTLTDSVTAWTVLIQAFANRGETTRALEELTGYEQRIAAITPRSVLVLQNASFRTVIVTQTEQWAKAKAYIEQVAEYDAERAELLACYLPIQMLALGQEIPEAIEKLRSCEALLAATGPAYAKSREIFLLVADKEYAAAADRIDKELAAKVDVAETSTYAMVNRRAGRYDRAIELIRTKTDKGYTHPLYFLELAKTLVAKGETEAAREPLQKALDTYRNADPDHLFAKEALALAAQVGLNQ
ncbi:hypothetical protein QWY85_20895 [Neolewinella lacunae]|uniref:Tetratricopeptide repeat protein n=1 Tax=Neolewinella lacunae TaxID=1517758 RepID=A0A923T789_9BACT|nr:hypothetical protein [Neolewinella lacunae]MBC6994240.1 hypothetical protein [Neolewinella lacunae]MDN3637142.1 hypothetical protein [Neolewinella lacunae]